MRGARRAKLYDVQHRCDAFSLERERGGNRNDAGFGELLSGRGLGGLHLERVIEPVEVVEEADGGHELDDFAFGVEAAEADKVVVGVVEGVEGHALGEVEGDLFGFAEEGAIAEGFEGFDLIGGGAEAERDGGVAGEAIRSSIELRGTDDDELFEARGEGAGVKDGVHVRGGGAKDFWAVGEGAEKVGDVAAVAQEGVVDTAEFGGDFGAIETADAWHVKFSCAKGERVVH